MRVGTSYTQNVVLDISRQDQRVVRVEIMQVDIYPKASIHVQNTLCRFQRGGMETATVKTNTTHEVTKDAREKIWGWSETTLGQLGKNNYTLTRIMQEVTGSPTRPPADGCL